MRDPKCTFTELVSVIDWLLEGDVSIRYQVYRDLLDEERPDVQSQIATEGWGAQFLAARNRDGTWGRGFYQPKWTSSHYTLLDLRTLCFPPDHPEVRASVHIIARDQKGPDGGINPSGSIRESDVCINGMFLNYASWFGESQSELESVVDFILSQRMEDGGFNCRRNRSGARHSSFHSTISVCEGILEYHRQGYTYRTGELDEAAASSREFMLRHRLFRSDHTGAVIHQDFLRLSFPYRWKYNVLRGLDYFVSSRAAEAGSTPVDPRLSDALDVMRTRRRPDGTWALRAAHPGQNHLQMEKAGRPSRWNTLITMRVIRHIASVIPYHGPSVVESGSWNSTNEPLPVESSAALTPEKR